MSQMMFDVVHTTAEMLGRKAFTQHFTDSLACAAIPKPVDDQTNIWTLRCGVHKLPEQICPAVLIECNMLNIGKRHTSFTQAVCDGV